MTSEVGESKDKYSEYDRGWVLKPKKVVCNLDKSNFIEVAGSKFRSW